MKLVFTTTSRWTGEEGFGCARLGLPGLCDNNKADAVFYKTDLDGIALTGSYDCILEEATNAVKEKPVLAAVVVFGNAGGENAFLADLQKIVKCPMVGGGAAIDGPTGRSGLIPGAGPGAVFLITDDRFSYKAVTQNIHDEILETCYITYSDPRTILTINGEDAAIYLARQKAKYSLPETDFEHLTLSDLYNVNAHLSMADGAIKSGRDVQEKMLLRYVAHEKVYAAMQAFYDDPDAIVFGCAGLSGLLDKPLSPRSLGLFLFGEVCTVDGKAEFGNLMLSKLIINK